jgi:hypothetical protein
MRSSMASLLSGRCRIRLVAAFSRARATSASSKLRTSQFTFPQAVMAEAYTASGYSTSAANLARISNATDNVFSDGVSLQTATMTGNVNIGYSASLTAGI